MEAGNDGIGSAAKTSSARTLRRLSTQIHQTISSHRQL